MSSDMICSNSHQFEEIYERLSHFGELGHERIQKSTDPNIKLLTTAKSHWLKRAIIYLCVRIRLLICCQTQHPSEKVILATVQFFESNIQYMSSKHLQGITKLLTIKCMSVTLRLRFLGLIQTITDGKTNRQIGAHFAISQQKELQIAFINQNIQQAITKENLLAQHAIALGNQKIAQAKADIQAQADAITQTATQQAQAILQDHKTKVAQIEAEEKAWEASVQQTIIAEKKLLDKAYEQAQSTRSHHLETTSEENEKLNEKQLDLASKVKNVTAQATIFLQRDLKIRCTDGLLSVNRKAIRAIPHFAAFQNFPPFNPTQSKREADSKEVQSNQEDSDLTYYGVSRAYLTEYLTIRFNPVMLNSIAELDVLLKHYHYAELWGDDHVCQLICCKIIKVCTFYDLLHILIQMQEHSLDRILIPYLIEALIICFLQEQHYSFKHELPNHPLFKLLSQAALIEILKSIAYRISPNLIYHVVKSWAKQRAPETYADLLQQKDSDGNRVLDFIPLHHLPQKTFELCLSDSKVWSDEEVKSMHELRGMQLCSSTTASCDVGYEEAHANIKMRFQNIIAQIHAALALPDNQNQEFKININMDPITISDARFVFYFLIRNKKFYLMAKCLKPTITEFAYSITTVEQNDTLRIWTKADLVHVNACHQEPSAFGAWLSEAELRRFGNNPISLQIGLI